MSSEKRKVLDVPFIESKGNAGAAAMNMVLGYYGSDVKITDSFGNLETMKNHAKEKGFTADSAVARTISELRTLVDEGKPLIVPQWKTINKEQVHFRVVIGYDDNARKVIVHDPDPYIGHTQEIHYDLFNALWEDFSLACLFIKP